MDVEGRCFAEWPLRFAVLLGLLMKFSYAMVKHGNVKFDGLISNEREWM